MHLSPVEKAFWKGRYLFDFDNRRFKIDVIMFLIKSRKSAVKYNMSNSPLTKRKAIQTGSDGVDIVWIFVWAWVGQTVRQAGTQTVDSPLL